MQVPQGDQIGPDGLAVLQPVEEGVEGHVFSSKQRTRKTLIVTAYRLFERQGYDGTTTAEVSSATFFNHFATKEDLVLAEDGSRILDPGWTCSWRVRRARRRPVSAAGDRAVVITNGTRRSRDRWSCPRRSRNR
ncbi:TetR/AcrR family transcriptional regulator [Amycolatopsis japonica]|uniref:TetR/AcrR family transcriptional regulator n=1 Tax=Amycolatopsis japonica TaxID=208439 RepID=UPI00366AF7EB